MTENSMLSGREIVKYFYLRCAIMYLSRFLCAVCLPLHLIRTVGSSSVTAGAVMSCIGLSKVIMDIPSDFLSNQFKSETIMIGGASLMAGGSRIAARHGLTFFGMEMSLTTVSWQLFLPSRIAKERQSKALL